jgi:D-sedoheptulose 7-phosphate isomerase
MSYPQKYLHEVELIAKSINISKVEEMIEILFQVKSNKGRLFILGIGGSAGNAGHAVNDFRKLAGIEAYAPTDNISEITARTNDEGFETVFVGYLSVSKLNSQDCILILSVGGGDLEKNVSKNLCVAIDYAKTKSARIIGIVGKEGGFTQKHADVCLIIPQVNPIHITQHSEAFQAVIWHLIVSHPKIKENPTKW